MFGNTELSSDEIVDILNSYGKVTTIKRSNTINVFSVNEIKVDFVNYKYPWLDPIKFVDGIRMATTRDIAAIKINAIIGRGTKKDFIDLYYLLEQYTLSEILSFFQKKYFDASLFLAIKSITYFDDADLQDMPTIFDNTKWEDMKLRIVSYHNELQDL